MSNAGKSKRILVTLCRVLLGALFVFSGFTKAVDPMGTALKFGEYFNAFGMDWLRGSENFFAIALSAGEMTLGLLLMFGFWMRLVASVASIGMLFFTLFTLFIALTNPVADCGCFGDAIKLSNWGSFYKNMLVLLPLSIIVMANAWISLSRKGSWRDFLWLGVFIAGSASIAVYSLRHLPLIDFLPYKIGVNIPREMDAQDGDAAEETRLLYRDISTGKVQEFTMADTTWYDSSRWEYVNTLVAGREETMGRSIADFAILSAGEDVTMKLIDRPGQLFMLCMADPAKLSPDCSRRLNDAAREAIRRGGRVIAVTPAVIEGKKQMLIDQNTAVDYYNIDDVVLKSMLRAKAGLVVLDGGTIVDKRNCRDIPAPGKFPEYGK